jgi:hypothetical protein
MKSRYPSLISLLEKIMPFKDSTIINIYSFLNNLIFIIVNIFIIVIVPLVSIFNGNEDEVKLPVVLVGVLVVLPIVNITYRFNKILLNKLK